MTIKELRQRKNLTQDALAEQVGCSRITIARMEAGRVPVTMKIVEGLSRALELPVQDIYEVLKASEENQRHEEEEQGNEYSERTAE